MPGPGALGVRQGNDSDPVTPLANRRRDSSMASIPELVSVDEHYSFEIGFVLARLLLIT